MRTFSIRKRLGLATAVALVSLGIAGVAYAAVTSGPSRPTFTWANPADHITFNSITDNPQWGDERQLLKVRNLTGSTSDYATQTRVTDGEDVVLAIYFHNNAAAALNLVAQNTTAKFVLPSDSATTITPTAYISASNATPSQVWATADLIGDRPFTIAYEPGTAKLYTNNVNGATISDNVVGAGTLVGTNGTDGNVPGCAQYSGFVTIRAKVNMPVPVPPPTPTPTPTPPPVPTPVTPTPAVTPVKPVVTVVSSGKSLPNTGPGDIAGLFAGTSVLGGAGHYLITRRRH